MTANEYETIRYSKKTKRIATIDLARPKVLNAINIKMAEELIDVFRRLEEDVECSVVVIRGEERSFCAGFDVTVDIRGGGVREKFLTGRRLTDMLETIGRSKVVRIGLLRGHVVGAGFALAQMCQLRYATPDTILIIPELDFGTPYLLGGVSQLMREVGPVRAADMLLNCTRVRHGEPGFANIVTNVYEEGEIEEVVMRIAATLAARPDSLVLASVLALRRAEQDLLPDAPDDTFLGMFTRSDPVAREVAVGYVQKVTQKR